MSIQEQIETKLQQNFSIVHCRVENESHQHSGPSIESHFKVTLVTEDFVGQNLVARHRAVYALLKEEMNRGVHALALHTFTPEEWGEGGVSPASPQCMGGSEND